MKFIAVTAILEGDGEPIYRKDRSMVTITQIGIDVGHVLLEHRVHFLDNSFKVSVAMMFGSLTILFPGGIPLGSSIYAV